MVWGGGYGSLDFRGYVLCGVLVIEVVVVVVGGALIWTAKILLLYLYNNLKQSD